MTGPQTGRGRAAKGASAERAVVNWFRDYLGFAAERIRSGRSTDPGDVTWPGSSWLLDVKSHKVWRIPEWWRSVTAEAGVESATTGQRVKPALVVKVPGETDPGRWVAVVRVQDVEW